MVPDEEIDIVVSTLILLDSTLVATVLTLLLSLAPVVEASGTQQQTVYEPGLFWLSACRQVPILKGCAGTTAPYVKRNETQQN